MRAIALLFALVVIAAASAPMRVSLRKERHGDPEARLAAAAARFAGEAPLRPLQYKYAGLNTEPRGSDTPSVPFLNFEDEVWIGDASVGTPTQGPFPVIFDTGSSNFWVVAQTCISGACKGKALFNTADSTTYVNDGRLFGIPYGTGFVLGTLGNDTVTIGDVSVTNDCLGSADVMAEIFAEIPMSGILGCGFKDLTIPEGIPTVFDEMVAQGVIPEALFSTYLTAEVNSTDSFMLFGATDSNYYTGDFVYADVYLPSYWVVGMENTYVNGQLSHHCADEYCFAVIDTGTSIIAGPEADIAPMIASIGTVNADCSNLDSLPTVSFEISGTQFDVAPQTYVIQVPVNGVMNCTLGMEALPIAESIPPLWILGDPFLRQYYTVFDKTTIPPRVGFAPAVAPSKRA